MSSTPTSIPLSQLARHSGWEERLCGLEADEIAGRLGEADALQRGSDEERAIALSVYRILHSGVDPCGALGCDRVEWALNTLERVDLRFEALFRHAGRCARRLIVRQRATVALGAFLVAAIRFDEAEALFLEVLGESRGGGTIPERGACLNLCRLYVRQWRVFEGYLLAQHATKLFRDANDPIRELHSMDEALGCLSEMREWDAFDALMSRAQELLETLPADGEYGFALIPWQMTAALERGRVSEALRILDELPPPEEDHRYVLCRFGWRYSWRGAIQTVLGDLDDAARLFELARANVEDRTRGWYTLLIRQARCAALRGDDALLVANAEKVLDRSHDEFIADVGSGRAIQLAISLATCVRDRGHEALARAAFDRAAVSTVARIREIDRVVREIPELSFVTPADRTLLSRVRRRFDWQHRELLASLVTLFERAEAAGEPWLEGLRSGGQAVICAWCARLRNSEGNWVPIGHFVPDEGPLPLSHGACEECFAELWPTFAGPDAA